MSMLHPHLFYVLISRRSYICQCQISRLAILGMYVACLRLGTMLEIHQLPKVGHHTQRSLPIAPAYGAPAIT